jgi:hypothetical protein
MNCTPQAVFDVLSDGWTYATWVVGASRIRGVDADFPAPGSKVHHSVGVWPLLIDDQTEVESMDAPHEMQLLASVWPAGEGRIHITCVPQADRTEVTMDEQVVSGPARLVPSAVEGVLLRLRNEETLKRLAFLAESGARSGPRQGSA